MTYFKVLICNTCTGKCICNTGILPSPETSVPQGFFRDWFYVDFLNHAQTGGIVYCMLLCCPVLMDSAGKRNSYCKGKGKYTCKLHKVLIFAEKGYIKKL